MEKHLHVSVSVLWNVVNSGHTEQCRDCREFVWDFSREGRSQGLLFPDLLASVEKHS